MIVVLEARRARPEFPAPSVQLRRHRRSSIIRAAIRRRRITATRSLGPSSDSRSRETDRDGCTNHRDPEPDQATQSPSAQSRRTGSSSSPTRVPRTIRAAQRTDAVASSGPLYDDRRHHSYQTIRPSSDTQQPRTDRMVVPTTVIRSPIRRHRHRRRSRVVLEARRARPDVPRIIRAVLAHRRRRIIRAAVRRPPAHSYHPARRVRTSRRERQRRVVPTTVIRSPIRRHRHRRRRRVVLQAPSPSRVPRIIRAATHRRRRASGPLYTTPAHSCRSRSSIRTAAENHRRLYQVHDPDPIRRHRHRRRRRVVLKPRARPELPALSAQPYAPTPTHHPGRCTQRRLTAADPARHPKQQPRR